MMCGSWFYETMEDDEWIRREGLVPLRETRPVRVWVTLSNKSVMENYLEDDKEKHFTNKERKMVNQGFQNVLNGFESKVVSEVFSPPRIAELAAKRG